MKVVLQRVKYAKLYINNLLHAEIATGFMLLVGFTHNDSPLQVEKLAKKIANIRIFSDANGKMNCSLSDVGGEILSVSQFTLYADTAKGNRPSFTDAMSASEAKALYNLFNEELAKYHINVKTGVFGADMQIELLNDGPVTINFEEIGE